MQANMLFFKQSELDITNVSFGTFIYVWDTDNIEKRLGFKTRNNTIQWITLGIEESLIPKTDDITNIDNTTNINTNASVNSNTVTKTDANDINTVTN